MKHYNIHKPEEKGHTQYCVTSVQCHSVYMGVKINLFEVLY